ncbi:hypothetical protein D3C72_2295730 [compost metagenome]
MVATAIGAIWLCTLINLRGIGAFGLAQNLLTALKLVPTMHTEASGAIACVSDDTGYGLLK